MVFWEHLFSTWCYNPLIIQCKLPSFPRQKDTVHVGFACKDTNFLGISQILYTFFTTF